MHQVVSRHMHQLDWCYGSIMEPIHSVEYELTGELAMEVQRCLLRWELRRGRWQDAPVFVGALTFTILILWLGLRGWILPGVGGGLLCVVALAVIAALLRRRWAARAAIGTALVALHTTDRRVRIGRRSEEHTSELQSRVDLVCRLLLEKKKKHNARQGAKIPLTH